MTTANTTAVVELVRKLLALAGNAGATEAEAALAMEKARDILAAHNLSMEAVAGEHGAIEEIGLAYGRDAWRGTVALGVTKLYFCRAYAARDQRLMIVGKPADAKVAALMLPYVWLAVERATPRGHSRAFNNSFRRGAAQRVYRRCLDMIAARSVPAPIGGASTTLPALASLYDRIGREIEAYLRRVHGFQKFEKTTHRTTSDAAGYHAGKAAGDGISLGGQVAHTSRPLMIAGH